MEGQAASRTYEEAFCRHRMVKGLTRGQIFCLMKRQDTLALLALLADTRGMRTGRMSRALSTSCRTCSCISPQTLTPLIHSYVAMQPCESLCSLTCISPG